MSLSMLPKLVARVRGPDAGQYPENRDTEQVHMAGTGDGLIAQGLPDRAELVRLGNSWQVVGSASTGLTTTPTTAALLTLWNGEPEGGSFYAIDSIACTKVIADVTTPDMFTVWYQQVRSPVAPPTDAALAIRSLSGRQNYGGRARTVATGTTLANRWDAIDPRDQDGNPGANPTVAGTTWMQSDIHLFGSVIIPPRGQICLTASEVTATASTFRFTIRWHEIQAALVS